MKSNAHEYLNENFEILKEVHTTEKNTIFLALNKNDHLVYIIKHHKLQGAPYKELQSLNINILPRIFFIAELAEYTIVVEEYIHGQTLQEALVANGDILPEALCVDLLQQLCRGLAEIHRNKIIHRDIKPSNIMLTSSNKIKLIDFDAARIIKDDQKHDTQYLGTRGYAPPEQYGFGQTDIRTDIYSIGATFKELLGDEYTGKLHPILDKCMELNPKNRYQTINELLSDIAQKSRKCKIYVISLIIIAMIGFATYSLYHNNYKTIKPEGQVATEHPKFVEPQATITQDRTALATSDKPDVVPKPLEPAVAPKPVEPLKPSSDLKTETNNLDTTEPLKTALKDEDIHYGQFSLVIQYSGEGNFYADYKYETYKIVFPTVTSWRSAKIKTEYPSYYFPDNEYVVVKVTNDSDKVMINPVLRFSGVAFPASFLKNALGETKLDMPDVDNPELYWQFYWQKTVALAPKESQSFQIPLSQVILQNVSRQNNPITLHAEIAIDNGSRVHRSFDIFFEDLKTQTDPFK